MSRKWLDLFGPEINYALNGCSVVSSIQFDNSVHRIERAEIDFKFGEITTGLRPFIALGFYWLGTPFDLKQASVTLTAIESTTAPISGAVVGVMLPMKMLSVVMWNFTGACTAGNNHIRIAIS